MSLAATLPGITEPALRKRGFAQSEVITRWSEIVGPELAAGTAPEKLTFRTAGHGDATLHVRVSGPLATELQHLEPVVLERINTYFGYRAVGRLALVQGPLPARPQKPPPAPTAALDDAEEGALERSVSGVKDESLRRALTRLGRAVKSAHKAAKTARDG